MLENLSQRCVTRTKKRPRKSLPRKKIEVTKNLRIFHWNIANGLANKMLSLKNLINQFDPDVIFINESEIKINKFASLEFFQVKGYDFWIAKTFERGNARIACYVRKNLGIKRIEALERNDLDIIVLESSKIRICGIYRAFKLHEGETNLSNFSKLLDTLENITATKNAKELIVIGDINVDWNKNTSQRDALIEWAETSDLHQICKEITRFRIANRLETSILDHCYVRNDLKLIPQIIPNPLSDHSIIIIDYPIAIKKSEVKEKILLREWRNYNADRFIKKVRVNKSIPYKLEALIEETLKVMEKEMPLRVVRFKPQKGQFSSTKIAKVTKKRDRFIKKVRYYEKKGWPTQEIMEKAKQESKRLKRLCKNEEKKKVQTKLQTNNPKSFWHTINTLLGHTSEKQQYNIKLEDDTITQNKKEIADTFVKFFKEKVDKLTINAVQDEPYQVTASEYLDINEEEIIKAGKKLRNKKCFGPDGVPLRIIKDMAIMAPQILVNHLNMFARMGLPEKLKTSRVIPLHKKDDKSEPSNYRPISNLSAFSKIYEKVLLTRLMEETKDMEGNSQHAYRPFHSTTTALLELQHKISSNLEEKLKVACYSIDLSAAFDVLRPGIMMNILRDMQVSHGLAHAIKDFLMGRKIYVDVDGAISEIKDMNIGCVQGSILGPRLFTLYMGKLIEAVKEEVVSYADDTYVVIKAKTDEELKEKVKEVSKQHIEFLKRLGMVVNRSKTEVVVFDKEYNKTSFDIDGEMIDSKPFIKALGLTIQHDLNWDKHVSQVTARIAPKITLLKKIRKNMTTEQFLKVATCQLYSILYYAAPVWMNKTLSAKQWTKLRSVHYRILRAATRDYKRKKHRHELDKKCQRATPTMWSNYIIASTAIKIKRDRYPVYLCENLERTFYTERRRPTVGKFYDASRGKKGRHKLENRLQMMDNISWLQPTNGNDLSNDSIRRLLKEHFNFEYK